VTPKKRGGPELNNWNLWNIAQTYCIAFTLVFSQCLRRPIPHSYTCSSAYLGDRPRAWCCESLSPAPLASWPLTAGSGSCMSTLGWPCEPLRCNHGIRIGSPGISSAPNGISWLKEFLSLICAGGSDVDFYALHWYGEGLGNFCDYLWSGYCRLGADKPI